MLLPPDDLELFFKLQRALMLFVNQRLKAIPDKFDTPDDFADLSVAVRVKVRDALSANLNLIETFVDENPARFPEAELDIVRSWRHLVAGQFCIFRELKKYTIFLSLTSPTIAYGVLALSQPFEDLIGPNLPLMVSTVLLPFKEGIVYDGMMGTFNIFFGHGILRSMNESFTRAKGRQGIVSALPMSTTLSTAKPKTVLKPPSRQEKDESLAVIVGLIDSFCKEHLNEEYAVTCRKLAEKLARKRNSPLLQGSPNAWASGIVQAIGAVNCLDDESQTPHMPLTDIDYYLETSPSSAAAKLAAIRKMLKMYPLDPNWTLPSRMNDNPWVWLIELDGIKMDVREAPREVRERAFNKGLIPYIPPDRQQGE
jgi:Domain of unknown function (DUF6398)